MRFTRHYSSAETSPFDGVEYTLIDIDRPHSNKAERCCVTDFEVPTFWSERAAEILVTLYAKLDGIPSEFSRIDETGVPTWLQMRAAKSDETKNTSGETSIKHVVHRIVGATTYHGWKHDYFDTEEDAKIFYDELCYLLLHQHVAPASVQWMHGGLHWAYGLSATSHGNWRYDSEQDEIIKADDALAFPALHSCFIQSVDDALVDEGGIQDLLLRESRAFKYGATTGSNMSRIRAAGEHLSNGEVSPGLINFLSVGDRNAGAIHARTSDKRTSKLVVVDADHPDVPAYLRWKLNEEIKAAAMLCGMQHIVKHVQRVLQVIEQAGDDCKNPCDVTQNPKLAHVVRQARRNHVPESLITQILQRASQGQTEIELPVIGLVGARSVTRDVSAHQVKLALRVGDDFMQAASQKSLWHMSGRSDTDFHLTSNASDILHEVSEGIWSNNAPHLHFSDSIARWNTCPQSGSIHASNANSESFFIDDTATPQATLNSCAFAKGGTLDTDGLLHAVRLLVVWLDLTHSAAHYPSRAMAEQTTAHRPLGLSACNLTSYLMQSGIAFDSDQGRDTLTALVGLITGRAYNVSVELAKEHGAFGAYRANKKPMQTALQNQAAHTLEAEQAAPILLQLAEREWSLALVHGERHGYRNAQTTQLAEMPMVMQLLQDATSAAEPMGALGCSVEQNKGNRVCSRFVQEGLQTLGYAKEIISDVNLHICGRSSLENAPAINHAALTQKGFEQEQLASIESGLAHANHINDVFDPWVLGERFCLEQLGIPEASLFDAEFNMLAHLGFSTEEIESANQYACGAHSIEQAPHISSDDKAIFACTEISAEARMAMLEALTPAVSGGIFHTITLANDTSISRIETLLQCAHQAGMKSLHLYREGNGLHMQTGFSEAEEEVLQEATPRLVSLRKLHGPFRPSLEQLKEVKA